MDSSIADSLACLSLASAAAYRRVTRLPAATFSPDATALSETDGTSAVITVSSRNTYPVAESRSSSVTSDA